MVVDGNSGGAPNYFPNSFHGPAAVPSAAWAPEPLVQDVRRYETGDEDNFSQCGHFYRHVLDSGARERLTDNISGHLAGAQEFIRARAIANFAAADADYGRAIAAKVAAKLAAPKHPAKNKAPAPLNPPRAVSKSSL